MLKFSIILLKMSIDSRNEDVQDGDGNESIDAKVCEASVLSFVF